LSGLNCGSATRNWNGADGTTSADRRMVFQHHLDRPNVVVRMDNDGYVSEVRVALWPIFEDL
jgi:hypothetical protein